MEEIWKNVKGFEEFYQVSNLGRVRSLDRYITTKTSKQQFLKGKVIKPIKCKNGYLEAILHKNGKYKVFLLHRLVAMHFIDNPDNLPEINHKNENIENCVADNLEWCTSKYNANYGTRNQRCLESNSKYFKPVYQMDIKGNIIKRWRNIADASRAMGISDSPITRVCKGKQATSAGYRWKYATD